MNLNRYEPVNYQLDRISLVGTIDDKSWTDILMSGMLQTSKVMLAKTFQYDKCISVKSPVEGEDWNIHVSWEGSRKSTRGELAKARLEFNPKYMVLASFRDILEVLASVFKISHCTRLDIALDYQYDILNKVQFIDLNSKRKSTIFKRALGVLETVYFGSRKSRIQVVFYDKIAQIADSEFGDTMCKTNPDKDYQRCEVRFNSKEGVQKFLEDVNPFDKLVLSEGFDVVRAMTDLKDNAFRALTLLALNKGEFNKMFTGKEARAKYNKLFVEYQKPVPLDLLEDFQTVKNDLIEQYKQITNLFN